MSSKPAETPAPLWTAEQYDAEIKALNEALRSEVSGSRRLRAELAAANEKIERLRREAADTERDALAARVPLLEAVAKAARAFIENVHFEKMTKLRKALAALDMETP
jgi:predicted  nucleic acid-binding Zn-ribbon protein